MRLSETEYQNMIEFSPLMMWRVNQEGERDYFNQTWFDFTGRTPQQELHDGWKENIHVDDLTQCIWVESQNFVKRKQFTLDFRIRRRDGQWRWIHSTNTPCFGGKGNFRGYAGCGMDITQHVENEHYKKLAENDSLTGVYSRRYLLQQLEKLFDQYIAQLVNITIAMLDIDQFKRINDTYGHIAGDLALKQFATVISNEIRSTDFVGRYGGDEFVIVFHDATAEIAQHVINRIIERLINTSLMYGEDEITISMSYGLCELRYAKSVEELLSIVDQRMYRHKREK